LNIREELEKMEVETLSPKACLNIHSKGRLRAEEPCPIRPAFQRDRDRIIHSKSFRRLKHKTQVFLTPFGDHYRTRLTHTLEVSQIARTIAKALKLNETLTEAIAMGHDLGHTPFGHAGEEVLNRIHPGGFKHNEQSLRVVEKLEKEGRGLNLTLEVRDGILHHSKGRGDILPDEEDKALTMEGEIVRIADIVAYVNHDIDDALRAGIINEKDTGGLNLEWGNQESILTLLHQMANNEGLGGVIGQQASLAVDAFSPEASKYLYTQRGMMHESPQNFRAARATALGEATGNRGSDHLKGRCSLEFFGMPPEVLEKIYGKSRQAFNPHEKRKVGSP